VKSIAEKNGLRATFMPKPFANLTGNGCHAHVSLWQKGKNVFDDPKGELGLSALAYEQFKRADNMTDAMAALACLAQLDCPERDKALEEFYARWKYEPLVVDKWLAVQAGSRLPQTLARVRDLLKHEAFDLKVPNKVYALIRTFNGNHVRFHGADGGGYAFLADQIIALNALNPQVAARMARGFDRWKKFDAGRQAKARQQLERIRDADGLSKDVAEIVSKALV